VRAGWCVCSPRISPALRRPGRGPHRPGPTRPVAQTDIHGQRDHVAPPAPPIASLRVGKDPVGVGGFERSVAGARRPRAPREEERLGVALGKNLVSSTIQLTGGARRLAGHDKRPHGRGQRGSCRCIVLMVRARRTEGSLSWERWRCCRASASPARRWPTTLVTENVCNLCKP
jgi:hypothetical protein